MKKKSVIALLLVTCVVSFIFAGCGSEKVATKANYNLVVDGKFTGTNGEKVDGIPTYKTVTAALAKAPKASKTQYVIFIKSGKYHEKITVDKPNITFMGEDMNKTKLTYDVANSTKKPDGTIYGTFDSASCSVIAENFKAENLTFENAFDYPKNKAKANTDPTKLANPQAVALKFDKGNNHAYIKDCKITGYQDTLYSNSGNEYFTNCDISGCIDFIFGAGQAYFNKCNIISLDLGSSTDNGYLTAPSTSIKNKYGFVFYTCNLKKGNAKMKNNTVSLGRPWHPTTLFANGVKEADPDAIGSSIYIDCNMGSQITKVGWHEMSGKDKNGNVIWFTPENSRFYEYGSKGPGAIKNSSRKLLSKEDAQNATEKNVLNGWNPQ